MVLTPERASLVWTSQHVLVACLLSHSLSLVHFHGVGVSAELVCTL